MRGESVSTAGFEAVEVPFFEWASPTDPNREGERVLWADGTAHNFPEAVAPMVTVLRKIEGTQL